MKALIMTKIIYIPPVVYIRNKEPKIHYNYKWKGRYSPIMHGLSPWLGIYELLTL